MKKVIVTTICLVCVYLITFKAVPQLFPGIAQLNDYKSLQIRTIEDNNFPSRLDALQGIVDRNNKVGTPYVIDNQQKLKDAANGQINFDKINPTAPINESFISEQAVEQAKNSTSDLEFIQLDTIQLKEVKEEINGESRRPVFVFTIDNTQLYTAGVGLIGKTDVFVESIDIQSGSVVLKQGQNIKTLTIDHSASKEQAIQEVS